MERHFYFYRNGIEKEREEKMMDFNKSCAKKKEVCL